MRKRTSAAVFLSCVFLASCSDRAGSAATTGAPAATDSSGKSTFSAVVDGTPVSGGAIDDFQQFNVAYASTDGRSDGLKIRMWLHDNPPAGGDESPHELRFDFPKKTGAIDDANLYVTIELDKTHEARYTTRTASVNVTSLSAARIAGTFSGALNLSPDTPNVPKTKNTVTDGKFDVPFSTKPLGQ